MVPTAPEDPREARPRLARQFTTLAQRFQRISPVAWLLLASAVAAVTYAAVSELRFLEFQTGNWDLGIYMQALWSTVHGRPFYEAGDWETGGFSTFLQVHSAFVLYAVVPIYGAEPSALTLFIVQAIVVAAASVPLYYFALAVTRHRWLSLLPALLYLAGAATISSVLYDFHIEAFVPLAYFAFLWSFERARYGLSVAFAAFSFVTMEVMPALLAGVALCYVAPIAWSALSRWRHRTPGRGAPAPPVEERSRRWACLLLLIGSLAGYLALVELREQWLGALLHVGPFPTSAVTGGYTIGATPGSLGLSLANLDVGLTAKVGYWVLLFALCGFLPAAAPRSLLLSMPWFTFTLLSGDLNLTQIGWQYGFLAGPPLFAGCALALGATTRARVRHLLLRFRTSRSHGTVGASPRLRSPRLVAGALAVGLIAVNLALSPIGGVLSGPGLGVGYRWSTSVPPGFSDVSSLVGLVPAGAPVLASDDLFPLVANDLNAYSLLWGADPDLSLPFNSAHPPPFVLLASNRLYAVPAWLESELYNASDYAVRGTVWTSPVGPVALFEMAYSGAAETFGASPAVPTTVTSHLMIAGPSAALVPAVGTPDGMALVAPPGSLGLLAETPEMNIPAGSYLLEVPVRVVEPTPPADSNTTVVLANANGFGEGSLLEVSSEAASFSAMAFTTWSVPITLHALSFNVIFRFYLASSEVGLAIGGVALVPVGSAA